MSAPLANLGKALAAARAEFRLAEKDGKNPMLKNRFASLASIMEACEEALDRHGLTFTQPIVHGERGPALRTVLIHIESGETIESECPLLCEGNRGINAMQALGSAVTYARRYSLESLLGILREDDDAEGTHPQREPARDRQGPPEAAPSRPLAPPAPAPTNGKTAGKSTLMDWFEKRAARLGIHPNQLVHHCAKVAVEDGHGEFAKVSDPRAKAQVFAELCRSTNPTAPEWREWLKGQVESYKAELAAKRAHGEANHP